MTTRHTLPRRDELLRKTAGTSCDVLVVGAGINGAATARECAASGLRTVLLEKNDVASGTSSRSSRLIHGGLRYLEHGHLRLVFESIRERETLLRIAPHLVRPLRFTWPVYSGARLPLWKLRLGLTLYDLLALRRGAHSHHSLTAADVTDAEPALRSSGLLGGVSYHDAATNDSRLTLANVLAARNAGAVVLNHVRVENVELLGDGAGITAHDMLGGTMLQLHARVVVNATGPWSDQLLRQSRSGRRAIRGSKGVHISLPRSRISNREALTLLSPLDGRVMFVLPSGSRCIIGTTDTETDESPDDVRPEESDVAYLLDSANAFFPDAQLYAGDVVSAWAGIRPLAATMFRNDAGSASREHSLQWEAERVLSITGGKLTTYRVVARQVLQMVLRKLGVSAAATAGLQLPGVTDSVDAELGAAKSVISDEQVARAAVRAYGSEWREVWRLTEADPGLANPITPGEPLPFASVVHAARKELACTIGDVLIRRTNAAFAEVDHASSAAQRVSEILARELGWTEDERRRHLDDYAAEVRRIFTVEKGM